MPDRRGEALQEAAPDQYERGMVRSKAGAHDPGMIRRLVALVLWTYFAWYLGAMLAAFTGAPAVAGPIAAVITAAVCVLGWVRASRKRAASGATLEPISSVSR